MNDISKKDMALLAGLRGGVGAAAWVTKELKAGASPDAFDGEDLALSLAFHAKRYAVARILLRQKANPNFPYELEDDFEYAPHQEENSRTPFWHAALKGDLAACAIMLCESNYPINLGQHSYSGGVMIKEVTHNRPFARWFFLLLARFHGSATERKDLLMRSKRLGNPKYAKLPPEKVLFD